MTLVSMSVLDFCTKALGLMALYRESVICHQVVVKYHPN
jgi:hypothetical protein